MTQVLVIGGGVVGLTAAIRLREAGIAADVVARDQPERTTSAVAAALWYPYRAFPRERVAAWSARGFAVLSELAGVAGTGVRMRAGTELIPGGVVEDPWWRGAVPTFERTAEGYRFEAPVADMSVHLPWLVLRFESLGGTGTTAHVAGLDDALRHTPVVVNCTGLGARELAGDPLLVPIRGQVVYVEQAGIEEWLLDQSDAERPVYVVPRERDVVLGGTAQEDDERLAPDPATAVAIHERCVAAVPALRDARILGEAVGLRPARASVRLEAEARPGGTVVHCYGHGGAGVTLAWGCADDVVTLVREALAR
ncbi:MAG: D-amino-acid oxidase [Solirubrobacteraceae bacterium]|jgi:D-amino-acid oxidase|nr:D-amino-acid oxidase [Solirubrobacteraceae bacterium]